MLKRKLIKISLIILGDITLKRQPVCPFCNKPFKRISGLKKHLDKTRSEIANYSIDGNTVRKKYSINDFFPGEGSK